MQDEVKQAFHGVILSVPAVGATRLSRSRRALVVKCIAIENIATNVILIYGKRQFFLSGASLAVRVAFCVSEKLSKSH